MINQQRRTALKVMGASGVLAAAPGVLASQLMSTASGSADIGMAAHLRIDIWSGSGVPEDSIVIHNTTGHELVIEHFRPGIVVLKDQVIDLNTICQHKPLVIAAGALHSSTAAEWRNFSTDAIVEYVHADQSVIRVSDGADLVKVTATMHGRSGIVIPASHVTLS